MMKRLPIPSYKHRGSFCIRYHKVNSAWNPPIKVQKKEKIKAERNWPMLRAEVDYGHLTDEQL
jgi:hypothetical protein